MTGTVRYEVRGAVAVLTVENPPVNALSSGVRQGLFDGVGRAAEDPAVKAMVVIGGGRTFPAGADITEFGKPPAGVPLHDALERMERSKKPIVAAIHGTALGGGLETALCCDYRVASPDAKVGLPEVNLGLLPGAGGTQRLPRLCGVEAALRIMITGEPVPAAEAHALGIVDAVIDGDLLGGAIAFAEELIARGAPVRKIRDDEGKLLVPGLGKVFEAAKAMAAKRRRGQRAPELIIQCVEAAVNVGRFDEGLDRERELFFKAMGSPQREAMIHVFFAERQAARIPDVPKETVAREVTRAAVIGGGTMGRGIAMSLANAGIPVKLVEVDRAALEKTLAAIRAAYDDKAKRGRLSADEAAARAGRVEGAASVDEIGDADLVIEAVFEEMDLKKEVFARLDRAARPDALLATNTSTLDVDAIAAATSRPAQVVGMHFFSPADVMRLLEVVRGAESGKESIATAMAVGRRLGKIAVLAGNCDGFIGNRMLAPYTRETLFLLEEGALPEQIDRAMETFGMAMGPCAMMDLAGLDVGWRIRKRRGRRLGVRDSIVADRLCEIGRFGQKSGGGFYHYAPGSRVPAPDPAVERLIVETAAAAGIERRPIADDAIVERLVYALVNEGARVLEDKIAIRSSDIDVVYVHGYGFPVHRGGPMFHADQVGLPAVLDAVRRLHAEHGNLWQPAPLLERLAAESGRFGSG